MILVVGATGATGRLLVQQLLDRGLPVNAVVRSPEKLPAALRQHELLSLTQASILKLSEAELAELVKDCSAIASCLGHSLNLRGIYGQPRKLVTDATRRLCKAVKTHGPNRPVKYVLMNTAGNSNRDLDERLTLAERIAINLIRALLPPHVDNEQAADYLRTQLGQDDTLISWAVVRPDSLTNEEQVSAYEVHASPTRSALFNPGKSSRVNVAHFMAELISSDELWHKWRGKMPVLYNKAS